MENLSNKSEIHRLDVEKNQKPICALRISRKLI